MTSWEPLNPEAESELHKDRLLLVEQRPFQRIPKCISQLPSLITPQPSLQSPRTAQQIKEDFTLDFAHFDSSILRLQFLHEANVRERGRYAEDEERIKKECDQARETNGILREQLEGARATLAQRKKFDEMAEKITSNRLLRPREEQLANLQKLEEECRDLEKESETYAVTWRERRDQFNRIMDEGMMLRRQIRDEKEEVDRREGMNEGADDEGANTPRPEQGGTSTPGPESDGQAKEGGDTPMPAGASNAPTPAVEAGNSSSHLHPGDGQSFQHGSRHVSREPTPLRQEVEDEEMDEPKESGNATEVGTPRVAADPPNDKMEVD
ncbi:THO complex subunit-like protein [Emericellopsis cladophorae]|uniref:THO complex subunit-like protein n=1 Tax=Emericellopsis cladophorae TaxID=2686198 RepID=A0A9P9YA17_9HYPO|nr:THO complex subunit-like protein [Emericellopsis cladophorae]KAI6785835.1 THO complex subunit-like protein [Emericellopsis cladophorae]